MHQLVQDSVVRKPRVFCEDNIPPKDINNLLLELRATGCIVVLRHIGTRHIALGDPEGFSDGVHCVSGRYDRPNTLRCRAQSDSHTTNTRVGSSSDDAFQRTGGVFAAQGTLHIRVHSGLKATNSCADLGVNIAVGRFRYAAGTFEVLRV